MRLIDADELNEYIGRESLDTREKIFALVDRMPTLPNPCGKPCAFERPHGDCRDRLKEVFREASETGGDLFHLSQIERIIDGEDWL